MALTFLDGTTVAMPRRKGAAGPQPSPDGGVSARDLLTALRAASRTEGGEVLGDPPRWEPIVAALLSVLVKKGVVLDAEFMDEFKSL
jgi:type IV pilus assembly protein PilB